MKILYYSPHPLLNLSSPAGYGTHMREMIQAFRELGHEVQPLIMGGEELPTTNGETAKKQSLKTRLKPWVPGRIWSSLKDLNLIRFDRFAASELRNQIAQFQPDLIYERAAYLQSSGVRTAKETGVHHILEMNAPYTEEHVAFNGNSFLVGQGEKAEAIQLQLTDRVCVVSSALETYFMKKHDLGREKFLVTPNAVDPAKLTVDAEEVKKLRDELGLKGNLVVGFVGSIFPWHGVDLLVAAFQQVGRPDARLLIVGDGETLPDIRKQVSDAGLGQHVIFTGNIPHKTVFNYLDLMDITVMATSNWYGSPVKIFEYGAMRKAIIAPDNVPVRDVMENRKDGLLVEASVDQLVEAIRTLMNHETLRKKLAENFHQKVLQQYTWKDIARNVLALVTAP